MPEKEQLSRNDSLYAILRHGDDQLDMLEESNKFIISKLQAGDLSGLPALIEQRNLFENQLIKFNQSFLKILPDYSGRSTNKINGPILNLARQVREKALRVSESYLTLVGIIEDGQKSLLQRLRDTRLSSRALQSYASNTLVTSGKYLARNNKGKEGK
ncbi:MAG: hypothetical protein GXO75_01205 [Calditrichaeota bacterium]|nr:hypothetical protein [Calditrichota bacterium]